MTTGKQSPWRAVSTPVDYELVGRILALRPPARDRRWLMGFPENN